MNRTYEAVGSKSVWVRQAGEGAWEKRMCTLQLCFSPDEKGPQPRPAIIFRGKGVRISAFERAAWHTGVDVSFNEKAWATDDWCYDNIPKQLAPIVPGVKGPEALLLCDNLSGQCNDKFRKMMKSKHNVLVWNLPPGTTDITQPVDSGYGRAVKRIIGAKLASWLENEANLEKWETGRITTSERRILITIWVAEAVAEVNQDRLTLKKYWQRTGCLLTADGTLDDLVHLHSSMPQLGSLPPITSTKDTKTDEDDQPEDESATGGGIGLGLGESKRESKSSENKNEKEGNNSELKVKVKDDPDNVKHDDDVLDLDEEDDDDPELRETSLRDAVPKEFKVVDSPPRELNQLLIGSSFAMKWTVTGWSVGTFKKYYPKPKGKNEFNFHVHYPIEVRDQRFQLKDYSTSDDAPYGAWCILQTPDHTLISYSC